MKAFVSLAVAVLLFFVTTRALAHKPSDSYLTLDVDGSSVHGRWDIAVGGSYGGALARGYRAAQLRAQAAYRLGR